MDEEDLPIDEETSSDDQDSSPEETPSARELIYANRERLLKEEAGETVEDEEKEEEPEQIKPTKIKVKIDGKEEEKDIDEIVRAYQKSEAADRRLQQAALALKEIEAREQQLEQYRQQLEQEKAKPKEPDTSLDQLKAARREALEIGDYDEFDRLDEEISQYRTSKQAPQIDAMAITQQASEAALRQIQYDKALEKFQQEHSDILQDNVLANIASTVFDNMCKESQTYEEAFEKTGRAMKEWISGIAPKAHDSALTERQIKKQSIQSEPGRLSVKSIPPKAEKEETASDIVKAMRQARGLPV